MVLTFGGQTAIDLAKDLAYADVPIAGLTAEAIEITEDRERFAGLLTELGLAGPRGSLAATPDELGAAIDALGGLPVIVRPSWVIGGRGIAVLRDGRRTSPPTSPPTSAGRSASTSWWRASSSTSTPSATAPTGASRESWSRSTRPASTPATASRSCHRRSVSRSRSRSAPPRPPDASRSALGLRGILNVQMIAAGDRIVVIEANPRASRTVPIVAKATGRDVVAAAVRCALGASLAEVGLRPGLAPDGALVAVKAPVGSLWRLPGVSAELGPEMRSTGEVIGLCDRCGRRARAGLEAVAAHRGEARKGPSVSSTEGPGTRRPKRLRGTEPRERTAPQNVASGPSFRQRRAPSQRCVTMPGASRPDCSKFRAAAV